MKSLAEVERDHIIAVIKNTDDISQAAKILGIARSTLYRKLKQYGFK